MATKEPALDKDLDHLYALPLADFVSARNALAARLQKEGWKREAAEIKALRKPSAAAWLVNQVVRKRRGEVDALLEAGGRMRAVQREAMADGGGDLRSVMKAERNALERVRRALDKLAAAREGNGNPAIVERALASLRAAAEGAEAPGLREGRLTEDIAPPGVEALVEALGPRERALPAPAREKPARKQERRPAQSPLPAPKQPRKDAEAHAKRIEQAEAALRRAEAEARALEAEAKQAKQDASKAKEEAKQAALEAKRTAQEAERRERIDAAKAKAAAQAKQKVTLARGTLEKAQRSLAATTPR